MNRWRLRLWPGAFALAAAVGIGFLALRMNVATDMSAFLPMRADASQQLLVHELHSGVAGRLVLAAFSGGSLAQRVDANRRLAQALRSDAGRRHFDWVGNGEDELTTALRERLFAARYLLSPAVTPARFSADALRANLLEQLDTLASSYGVVGKAYLAADPTNEFGAVLRQWQGGPELHRVDGVLASRDESRTLLLARTRASGADLDAQAAALAYLRAQAAPAAPVQLTLAGAPVYATAARAQVRDDATRLSTAASVLVLAFLYVVFRSARAVALSMLPLAFGVLAGLVATVAAFGHIHGITIAFGSTLIGVAVDYPLHYLSHLTQPGRSPQAQLQPIWPTLRLGAITTVIAFGALLLSGHAGLAQLGTFAIAGIVMAAATTRWLLPALIPSGFSLRPPHGRAHAAFAALARRLPAARWPLVLVPLASMFLLIAARDGVWERDVAQLSPLSATQKARDAQLRADLGVPATGRLLLIEAASADAALAAGERLLPALERLVADGALAGFDLAARYVPSIETQRARARALPDAATLKRNLTAAARGLPFRVEVFAPFRVQVAAARTQAPVTPAELAATPLGARLAPLLFNRGEQWVAPVLLQDVRDVAAVQAVARAHGAVYLDTKAAATALMTDYRDRALELLAFGIAGIFASLWLGLGSFRRAAWVLLSPLAAIVTVAAILLASGVALSLFHVIALLLVMGLGIDYALYFDRLDRLGDEWETTFPALWKAWLTSALGFAILSVSALPVLRALGVTVALGVSFAFLFGAAWARTGVPR